MHATAARTAVRSFALILAFQAHTGFAQTEGDKRSSATSQQRDGQHDFDFHFGTWKRSEEHTSELQSHSDLVCRLLLEKKKKNTKRNRTESSNSKQVHTAHIQKTLTPNKSDQ